MKDKRIKRNVPYYLCNNDYMQIQDIVGEINCFRALDISFSDNYLEYNWIYGDELRCSKKKDYYYLATCIAQFHIDTVSLGSRYIPLQFFTHFPNLDVNTIKLMVNNLRTIMRNKIDMCNYIIETLEYIFYKVKFDKLPKQIIHGDLHLNNIICDYDRNLHIIDFFDLHFDYRIIDIAWIIIFTFFWDDHHQNVNQSINKSDLRFFCECYSKINPLDDVEKENFYYAFSVLLVFSLFSNHSLWRNKRINISFYNNICRINNILGDKEWKNGIFFSYD